MNFEDIIARKIDYLNGTSSDDIDDKMQQIIDNDNELAIELKFVEDLWSTTDSQIDDTNEQPSPHMNARFYQMLSQAQSSQSISVSKENSQKSAPKISRFSQFVWLQPSLQALAVIVIFSGGWFFNQVTVERNNPIAALESQVDTLNAMVALNMLKNDSATERLAGLNYTKTSELQNNDLNDVLMEMLNTDDSNAVRLSAIDLISTQSDLKNLQDALVTSLSQQTNVIVQMALLNLLRQQEPLSKSQLDLIYSNADLDEDIIEQIKRYFPLSTKKNTA